MWCNIYSLTIRDKFDKKSDQIMCKLLTHVARDKFDRNSDQITCKLLTLVARDKFDRESDQKRCNIYASANIITLGLGRPKRVRVPNYSILPY